MAQGYVLAFSPGLDPTGVYGLGIVGVDDVAVLGQMIKNDPAASINRFEYHP